METAKLKKFAQLARRSLMEQVSAKLRWVLSDDSAARREQPQAVAEIERQIFGAAGKLPDNHKPTVDDLQRQLRLIERVAYIWFNRFCALRFMDVNRYTRIGVVSPAEGQFQPEILAEAKMGHIDPDLVPEKKRHQIFALLDGQAPSRAPQGEAYRLLLVAACNYWHKAMPFLFQRIDDYTELLMPDDLLSAGSILAATREAMTPDVCGVASDQWPVASKENSCHQSLATSHSNAGGVEVIGWLYQFYISQKKDEVFDGLKKNKKITPENIPAATQLFTPHWIVRYLVENSLGRLWLLNRPGSKLIERMDYYIKPEQPETDFLRIGKPEEIKICDPACGSGHMLTYAFDLLYAIYEEEGYEPAEIPEKILTHNLYGIEIDERAGELAAFALTMKARARQRRFFNKGVKPNICVLENVHFDGNELKDYMDFVGRDLFTAPLQTTLRQFEEADNFGSLIRPDVTDVDGMLRILESKNVSGQIFISMTHQKVLQALLQADYLSPKYHVVIANPPYMGAGGMNARLSAWAKENYQNSKPDLYSMFVERCIWLTLSKGYSALITMQSWMFISSFEKFRRALFGDCHISTMAHLGAHAFDSIGGEVVSTTAFVLGHEKNENIPGEYLRLVDGSSEAEKSSAMLEVNRNNDARKRYQASQHDFEKVPGCPIAYWMSARLRWIFQIASEMSAIAPPKKGMISSDNNRFLRLWHEVAKCDTGLRLESNERTLNNGIKWVSYNKGGSFRKWSGNREYLVNWQNAGKDVIDYNAMLYGSASRQIQNVRYYFLPSISWSSVTSSSFGVRQYEKGFVFDGAGPSIFADYKWRDILTGFLVSKVATKLMSILNPTMNFVVGNVACLPIHSEPLSLLREKIIGIVVHTVELSNQDWDSFETSWDFSSQPLLNPNCRQSTLEATYRGLRDHWRQMTLEMQRLEQENNRIFIDAYGLQDELTPDVPLNEITLTCNPHYRYGNDKSEEELEALLLADTMRELVSYAVGCMFGRYALDKPGLILANQGETIEDYLKRVSEPSFPADDDNVIPMLDGDWFTDDIAERFRKFLRVAFGEEHYEANLKFVEQALNIKGRRNYGIRDYFLGEFHTDHVKRYKKRPIYWLFSSPKGTFNALIYLHRYRPDTVSVVLNDYLREFHTKLSAHKNHLQAISISASAGQGERTRALKEIEKVSRMITELEEYEREVLYPLATERLAIDLDDGVKVNYPKFGAALKKIVGLDAPED